MEAETVSETLDCYLLPDSLVGIATGYWLTTEGSDFESRWGQEFSLLYVVQTGSESHQSSYPVGTGGPFPGGKAVGTLS
jgi:hypothetical protein